MGALGVIFSKDLLGCWWGLCRAKKCVGQPAAADLTPKTKKELPRQIYILTGRPTGRATLPGEEQGCEAPGDSCPTNNWAHAYTELTTDHRQPCEPSKRVTVTWPIQPWITRATKMVATYGGGLDGANKAVTLTQQLELYISPETHDRRGT